MPVKEPMSEREVLHGALTAVENRLPRTWAIEVQVGAETHDAALIITAPDGERVRLMFEAKLSVARRAIGGIVGSLRDRTGEDDVLVLTAKYLSPQVRGDLETQGISYVDATGNLRIESQHPAIFLAERGEDRDPWRGAGRPRGTLRGAPAAKVVRALLDEDRAWGMRSLVEASGASTGATYRVIGFLEQEGLVERSEDKAVTVPDWKRLLEAWSVDAPFLSVNRTGRFIDPRGTNALVERIASDQVLRYAVTGTLAASNWAPYAPARAAYIYVDSLDAAADSWKLRPTDSAPNVILVEPGKTDDVAFVRRHQSQEGLWLAAPTQVAADLLNGPGRSPAEAAELLAWMSANESEWRR